jgi:hypothetical protein
MIEAFMKSMALRERADYGPQYDDDSVIEIAQAAKNMSKITEKQKD